MDRMSYEFDAPQYFDFEQPEVYDEMSDSWFDHHTEDDLPVDGFEQGNAKSEESKRPRRVLVAKQDDHAGKGEGASSSKKTPNSRSEPSRILAGEKHEQETKSKCPSPMKKQKMSPDVEEQVEVKMDDSPAANTRSKIQIVIEDTQNKETEKPRQEEESKSSSSAEAKSQSSEGDKNRSTPLMKPKQVSQLSQKLKGGKSEANLGSAKSKPGIRRVNSLNMGKGKSTEQIELERIENMKKELARTRKMAQDSYKKAMTASGYVPVRSANPTTLPQEFKFKTNTRIKNTSTASSKVKEFTKSLREALPKMSSKLLPSKPQPFKVSAKSTSALHAKTVQQYESVAERVKAFHSKTPDRFHSQPHGARPHSADKGARHSGRKSPALTHPKTPKLTARDRTRSVHALTREQQEELEFLEHQKLQFKARPVNHKILEGGSTGVPKVEPRPLTVAKEFRLHKRKSMSCSDLSKTTEDDTFEFHAKPVNPRLFKGPLGVKPVEPIPLTEPQSPAFALRSRMKANVSQEEPRPSSAVRFANPVPNLNKPFRPKLDHQHTVPEPFAVEERSKQMLSAREQKIQQYLEEEKRMREFHAQALPCDHPDTLPPKQPKPITCPEPFNLAVDERGQKYQEQFQAKQVEEEERAAKQAAIFKATSSDVLNAVPFKPFKHNKPLTEFSDFALNTDIRASKREAFDQHMKEREAELEALKRQREERKEMEEKAAVARLRQEAVHKATGIKKYKTVEVQPSDKPLTDPKTPCFVKRHRNVMNDSRKKL